MSWKTLRALIITYFTIAVLLLIYLALIDFGWVR